jgi:hypothetical protein
MDSFKARLLPGTESPHIPLFFWSPDSRYIAFDAGGKLEKIDIAGGPAETVCDLSTEALGGSWSRSGVIIFGSSQGLMQVSKAGGAPSLLIKPDPARGIGVQVSPSFLPDGHRFLYFQHSSVPEKRGIYLGSLDPKPNEQNFRQLMRSSSGGIYVPPVDSGLGQILFVREQTLMAQHFDERSMELAGDSVIVADKVGAPGRLGLFSASMTGVLVYYQGLTDILQRVQASWFNLQGKSLGPAIEPGEYLGIALSPTDGQIAVNQVKMVQGLLSIDIWLHDFGRRTYTRSTFGKGFSRAPAWSSDGREIIFSSNRMSGMYSLYRKAATGVPDDKLLLQWTSDAWPASWSRDGRFLLYTTRDPKSKADLWYLPLESGRKPVSLLATEFNEEDGRFSPNMRWIAYESDESGEMEIYVMGFRPASGEKPAAGDKW